MFVCMYVCMNVYVCIYVCLYVRMYVAFPHIMCSVHVYARLCFDVHKLN
jgi:hypothetical protein